MDLKQTGRQKRFPLFDIALLLVLALAVIGAAYWAANRQGAPTVELRYTVRFSDVDNAYSGNLAEGKTLYTSGGDGVGVIGYVEISRAQEKRFDASATLADGDLYRYLTTDSSEKSDVTVTVTVTAEKRDGGYFVGDKRIAAGTAHSWMVNGFYGDGLILTVREAEPSGNEA